MTSWHGINRPNGAKSSLSVLPSLVGATGVSAIRLNTGSGGGVVDFATVGCGVGSGFCSALRGSNGPISRRTVAGSCDVLLPILASFGGMIETRSLGDLRLLTSSSRIARPTRKSVSAPVGERKKFRKRRGFIVGAERVRCPWNPARIRRRRGERERT